VDKDAQTILQYVVNIQSDASDNVVFNIHDSFIRNLSFVLRLTFLFFFFGPNSSSRALKVFYTSTFFM